MTIEEGNHNTVTGNRGRAVAMLAATALLWSSGGMLIKMIPWNPVAIAGGRSAIAALVMLLVLRRPKLKWSFPMGMGAVAYAATVILFVISNKMTTAANAILLQYTAPIYVAVLSACFLGERISRLDWAAVAVVLGGMVLFFVDDISQGNMLGNIMAVLSGISFAFMILFMRMQKDAQPLESAFWGNILTALLSLPFIPLQLPGTKGTVALVVLGVVQLGVSYILYASAIRYVTALEAVLIPVIEPILNPIWVLLFIGEFPSLWAVAGGIVVVGAVVMRAVIMTRRAVKKGPQETAPLEG